MRSPASDLLAATVRLTEALTWRANARAKAPLEKALEREVAKLFRAQGMAFDLALRSLIQESTFPAWETAWGAVAAKLGKRFVDAVGKAVDKAVRLGFRRSVADQGLSGEQIKLTFGGEPGQRTDPVKAWVRDHAAARVAGVNDETKRQIKQIITAGLDEGASQTEIAKRIQTRFTEFAVGKPQQHIQSRAHLVAVTEIGDAYAEGTLQASIELDKFGLPQEKS